MISFQKFKEKYYPSRKEIYREIFLENQDQIKIKKEAVAVKNLETIFDATLEISNQKGFQVMSVRDLSKKTELSMGALYSYFEGKDHLLQMIQKQGRLFALQVLKDISTQTDDPLKKLRGLLQSHLYLSELMQPWFYFSYMESRHFTKAAKEIAIQSELETEKLLIDCLVEGIEANQFQISDPVLVASMIKPILQDWYLKSWKYKKRKTSVEQYATFLIKFVESFILVPS